MFSDWPTLLSSDINTLAHYCICQWNFFANTFIVDLPVRWFLTQQRRCWRKVAGDYIREAATAGTIQVVKGDRKADPASLLTRLMSQIMKKGYTFETDSPRVRVSVVGWPRFIMSDTFLVGLWASVAKIWPGWLFNLQPSVTWLRN